MRLTPCRHPTATVAALLGAMCLCAVSPRRVAAEPVTEEEIAAWDLALQATIHEIHDLDKKLEPIEKQLVAKRDELAAVDEESRVFDRLVRKSSNDFKQLQADRALYDSLLAPDPPYEVSYENWRTGRTEKHRRPFKFLRERLEENIAYLQSELRTRSDRMGIDKEDATPAEIKAYVMTKYADFSTSVSLLRSALAELTSRQIELQNAYLEAFERNRVYRSLIDHRGLFIDELVLFDAAAEEQAGSRSRPELLEIHCRFLNKRDVPIHTARLKLGLRNQRGDLLGYREWNEAVDLKPADSFFFRITDVPLNAVSVEVVESEID